MTVEKTVSQTGNNVVTTPGLSTTNTNFLAAMVGSDGNSSGQTVTVSGGGLTWTLAKRANAKGGDSEIWTAPVSAQLSNATFSASQAVTTNKDLTITVVALQNVTGVGSSVGASAVGSPNVSLNATSAGSLTFGVGNDFDNAIQRVLGTGQMSLSQWLDTTSGDTYWAQRTASVSTAVGQPVTINDTSPTADQYNLVAVELVPASGPPPSTTTTLSPTTTSTVVTGTGPTVDTSTPAVCTIQNNVASTSCGGPSGFSPPAGAVVYALFSVDSPPGVAGAGVVYDPNNNGCQLGINNTGIQMCWKELVRENSTNANVGGFVDVWWAYNSTAQTGITVTANFAQPTKNVPAPVGMFRIVVMDGAAANQSAAPAMANANIGSSLTSTALATVSTPPKAQVFGLFDAWNSVPDPQTVPIGQIVDGQVINNTDVDSYWDELLTAPTTTSGSVTISATLARNDNWHVVAWAVLPA